MSIRHFQAPALGELRELLTIQQQVATTLPTKEKTFSWQDVATVHAKVKGVSGQHDGRVGVDELSRYLVTIRYRSDVRAGMRGTWDGVTYEFRSVVDPDGDDHWLLIDMQATAEGGNT